MARLIPMFCGTALAVAELVVFGLPLRIQLPRE
jgi:hypothetical protein